MQIISEHLFSREISEGGTSTHPFFCIDGEGGKKKFTYAYMPLYCTGAKMNFNTLWNCDSKFELKCTVFCSITCKMYDCTNPFETCFLWTRVTDIKAVLYIKG